MVLRIRLWTFLLWVYYDFYNNSWNYNDVSYVFVMLESLHYPTNNNTKIVIIEYWAPK
jgi:hypothetical protein